MFSHVTFCIIVLFFLSPSTCLFEPGNFFHVVSPSSISGYYVTSPFASFGPKQFNINGTLIVADPTDACQLDQLKNKEKLKDMIVLVNGEAY